MLITIDAVSRPVAKSIQERELQGLPRIIGVDVARFGAGRSVIQLGFPKVLVQGAD